MAQSQLDKARSLTAAPSAAQLFRPTGLCRERNWPQNHRPLDKRVTTDTASGNSIQTPLYGHHKGQRKADAVSIAYTTAGLCLHAGGALPWRVGLGCAYSRSQRRSDRRNGHYRRQISFAAKTVALLYLADPAGRSGDFRKTVAARCFRNAKTAADRLLRRDPWEKILMTLRSN